MAVRKFNPNRPAPISDALRTIRERVLEAVPENDLLRTQQEAIAAEIGQLQGSLRSLEKMREHRDPTITAEAHEKRISDAVKRFEQKVERVSERVNQITRDGSRWMQEAIDKKANLRPNQHARELRDAVRAMSSEARTKLLHDALDNGDGPTIAALTDPELPAAVTGIPREYGERIRASHMEKVAPDEYAAQGRIFDSLNTAAGATGQASRAAARLSDPARVAEIDAASGRADEAQSEFNEAVGNE